jgi:hypothetical protein
MSTINLWAFNLVLKATPRKFINKIKIKENSSKQRRMRPPVK